MQLEFEVESERYRSELEHHLPHILADIACYGYLQVAHEAGVDMDAFPNVAAWLQRVREQLRHVADLEPYPENAQRGQGQSIYDLLTVES